MNACRSVNLSAKGFQSASSLLSLLDNLLRNMANKSITGILKNSESLSWNVSSFRNFSSSNNKHFPETSFQKGSAFSSKCIYVCILPCSITQLNIKYTSILLVINQWKFFDKLTNMGKYGLLFIDTCLLIQKMYLS